MESILCSLCVSRVTSTQKQRRLDHTGVSTAHHPPWGPYPTRAIYPSTLENQPLG